MVGIVNSTDLGILSAVIPGQWRRHRVGEVAPAVVVMVTERGLRLEPVTPRGAWSMQRRPGLMFGGNYAGGAVEFTRELRRLVGSLGGPEVLPVHDRREP